MSQRASCPRGRAKAQRTRTTRRWLYRDVDVVIQNVAWAVPVPQSGGATRLLVLPYVVLDDLTVTSV